MKYLIILFLITLTSCSNPVYKKLDTLSSTGKCKEAISLANEELTGRKLLLNLGEIAFECEKNTSKTIKYLEKAGATGKYYFNALLDVLYYK
jgi:hypothetical protein